MILSAVSVGAEAKVKTTARGRYIPRILYSHD